MDAGDYDTNTLVVNNLSSIAFKIYEPVVSQSSTYTFNASDVECALRNDGHLVYMDAVRRGVWCFYLVGKDPSNTPSYPGQLRLGPTLEVCGYQLGLVEEGAFEPISLLKSRPLGTNVINTPSSSSSNNSALDNSARSAQSYNLPSGLAMVTAGPMDLDPRAASPIIKTEPNRYATVPVKEMHEFFITAILSSLSTAFCRCSGAISLTPRTLLLPSDTLQPNDGEATRCRPLSALASFRVYLTTTGSLVISLSVAAMEGLVSSADGPRSDMFSTGTPVLVAPLGAFASLQGPLDRENLLADSTVGQSPDTQISRFRPDMAERLAQFKNHLSIILQLRGMAPSVLEGCSWINIQFLKRKPYESKTDGKRTPITSPGPMVWWPSVLCFRKPRGSMLLDQGLQKLVVGNTGDFEPLDYAKSWFESNLEREELFSKRRKKEQEESAMRLAAEVDGRNQARSDSSPLTLRRISNAGVAAAAAGAMYPTPPDGVQQHPGITPSFDGIVSSPPHQSSNPAVADSDPGTASRGPIEGPFPDGWDGDQKREQPSGAFLEGENLFGDLGEDLFENNELTDADFSFFDEAPGGGGLDLSGLPDMSDAMDLDTDLEQATMVTSQQVIGAPDNKPKGPVSAVFTKPELKHARSSLVEESRQQASSAGHIEHAAAGIKRQPSPFNPDTVYKRIRASLHGPPAITHFVPEQPPARRGSVFEKMDFDPSLSLSSRKYEESGQFKYTLPDKSQGSGPDEPLATIPSLQQRHRKGPKQSPASIKFGELIAKMTAGLENNSLNQSPTKRDDTFSYADDMSLVSDQDDSSDMSDEPYSPGKSSVARRPQDDDNLSLAASFKDLEQSTAMESPIYGMADLSHIPQPSTPEVAVAKYFADPEPWPLQLSCPDVDFVTIAQILTEQAVTGSLVLGLRNNTDIELQETRRSVLNATRHSMQCLRSVLPCSLASAADTQFRPFIEVQDVPLLGQPTRQQRPVGQELVRHNLFQIPTPHVELRRYDSKLSVLPSAVAFWESLGLGPSQGAKDINATCVFPDWKGMRDNVGYFLDRIRGIYESLKMGNFDRMQFPSGATDGLFPYAVDGVSASPLSATAPRPGSALFAHMTKLASDLSTLTVSEKNNVVYFVYAPENPSSIVEACAGFQDLFEKYKKAMADKKRPVNNELVLQLIPMDYLASETSLAILTPSEYIKLCIETYDRCTVFGGPMPAPAIVLEPALPRVIDFKTSSHPSANVLHENSCIHIAYARSVDERWITAAWTDNRGSKQMTAAYCLGRRGKPLSNHLGEVAHEIWETTHDLISMWKVHWRVIITKCGPMEQTEVDYWMTLAQSENKASISLTLMTVDTNPSLQLIPPAAKMPVTASSAFYTTPVSTPQPISTLSPEQSGNPPTPMGPGGVPMTPGGENSATEPEADTTLIDVTDTTWGAIVSHRLNNSASLTELNPAIQSGYLIKRSGVKPEDPPVAMEVNVIHSEGNNPRAYEVLLREMLGYFRGLGTLARLRGMVDRETDVRPWHIAAAEKGVKALYQLM